MKILVKKQFNIILSLFLVTILTSNVALGDAVKKTALKKIEKQKVKQEKLEKKREDLNEKAKKEAEVEAREMYESKFPVIMSGIEYTETENREDLKNLEGGVTLEDCIKLALANNPLVLSAISNSEIYKTKIAQAWANYFPKLGAGVSYSRNDMLMTNTSYQGMNQKYNMYYTPTISANMMIFDFGKTKALADTAKKTYEQSRYDAQVSIEQVIYNVKAAYYNMLFARAQKYVYEDTVKSYELQLKQAQAFYNIGKKAKIDVTTAEYNLGNARVNLIKAKNTYELASVQLANAIGVPEFENVILKDELNKKAYDVNFDDLIEVSYVSRPSLLSAKKRMDAADLSVRTAQRQFSPSIDAFGSYNRGGAKVDTDSGYQFGLQLNYSSINLLDLKKKVDEAKANYRKQIADYNLEKQNVYLEVKSAFISLLNSKDSFVVARLALQQAKEQQYQAKRRYEVGMGNAIEFKDAQNTYLNAQLNYYSNLLDYNINAAELERVVGAPIKQTVEDL